MTLPIVFRNQGERTSFNFDFFDYISGAGYKNFYAFSSAVLGGNVLALSPIILDGSLNNLANSGTSNPETLNFDITFNNPAIIEGTAFISYSLTGTGGAQTPVFKIQHVRGAVVTDLGTGSAHSTGTGTQRETIPITLTRKRFLKNDKIRLNIVIGNTGTFNLYYDPTNRTLNGGLTESGTNAKITAAMILKLPFSIQLD